MLTVFLNNFKRISGVSRFFLIYPNDTLTGTDLHQSLEFVTFGNPPETKSGYATAHPILDAKHTLIIWHCYCYKF